MLPKMLRLEMRQECSFSPVLFKIVLEALTSGIRQENHTKCIQIGKKQNCLYSKVTSLSMYKIPKRLQTSAEQIS